MLSVSTKTGDKGETSLANGQRVLKSDQVFEVIGTIDELNSWLGLIAAKLESQFTEHRAFLLTIQDTLFYIGAEIAEAPKVKLKQKHLHQLEKVAHQLQLSLSDNWHSKFLLPGGTELGGYLDIARTVCRRAEREVLRHKQDKTVSELIVQYLNRLSDYLYLLRSFVNHAAVYPENTFQVH